jgi:sugar phosphate permease
MSVERTELKAGLETGRRSVGRWHIVTIALLAFGYAGYYFCRSNLPVVLPELIRDLAKRGISPNQAQLRFGLIASAGTLAYAAGKFIFGAIADQLGGRRNFLAGMAGSILFTIVFACAGGFPLFTFAWIINRFFQAAGWSGLVKISSRWFSYSLYGTVMAILSLSFLFGDAACRWAMSLLMANGIGWRGVFFAGAASLGALLVANLILLRETPEERGLSAPEVNPLNLYAESSAGESKRPGFWSILRPLVSSFPFWLVCLLSLGTTLLRETFNLWTPTYFVQSVGLSPSQAAANSALFPLFGGVAVLLAGTLSDRLGLNGRNLVMTGGMAGSTVCLVALGTTPAHIYPWVPVALVTLAGFLLLGPYSYLAGAMSLDFGGKRGSATAAGIIDGVGYLAGYLSGDTVARVTVAFGWKSAFLMLAVISLITALVALLLSVHQREVEGRRLRFQQ